MPGLVPGIGVFTLAVDHRMKPGQRPRLMR
jgi:hypothetical protein